MKLPRKCIATELLLLLALFLAGAVAWAGEVAGNVINLSGPLLARKADGTVKILSVKSAVEQGDTLVSEKDTYARIRFIDNSEITLRPGSQLKIDSFSFDEANPERDSAVFSLVKGGLRAVTGLLGKRNKERVGVNTPTATIGIRGTIFIAEYVAPDEQAVAAYGLASVAAANAPTRFVDAATMMDIPTAVAPLDVLPPRREAPLLVAQAGGRAPGLYVQVLDGMVVLSNGGGTQNFAAGQFGYVPSLSQPPVILPANPGMQFTPPPAFSSSVGPQAGTSGSDASNEVDCVVR